MTKDLTRYFTKRQANGQRVYENVHGIIAHQENPT